MLWLLLKVPLSWVETESYAPRPSRSPLSSPTNLWLEPGRSAIRVPSDLVDFKPATDVLLVRPEGAFDQRHPVGSRVSIDVGPIRISGPFDERWSFGPLRRDERPRKAYAGTFDQNWIENRMPLLPEDFDTRFNQAAPPNQQVRGYLKGDEAVSIANLYSEVRLIRTSLPGEQWW